MPANKRQSRKFFRSVATLIGVGCVVAAAVSPAAAATSGKIETGALAIILAFVTLMAAIIIEVWRQTMHDTNLRATQARRRIDHE